MNKDQKHTYHNIETLQEIKESRKEIQNARVEVQSTREHVMGEKMDIIQGMYKSGMPIEKIAEIVHLAPDVIKGMVEIEKKV